MVRQTKCLLETIFYSYLGPVLVVLGGYNGGLDILEVEDFSLDGNSEPCNLPDVAFELTHAQAVNVEGTIGYCGGESDR